MALCLGLPRFPSRGWHSLGLSLCQCACLLTLGRILMPGLLVPVHHCEALAGLWWLVGSAWVGPLSSTAQATRQSLDSCPWAQTCLPEPSLAPCRGPGAARRRGARPQSRGIRHEWGWGLSG